MPGIPPAVLCHVSDGIGWPAAVVLILLGSGMLAAGRATVASRFTVRATTRAAHVALARERQADSALEELLHELAHARGDERKRMAGELHDFALQEHIVALMHVDEARELLGRGTSDGAADHLDDAARSIRHGIRATRQIMEKGHAEPDGATFERLLHAAADTIERDHDVRVVRSLRARLGLPHELELVAHRLVLEALRNAGKHAGTGARVTLTMDLVPAWLRISVIDDGVGFPEPVRLRNDMHPMLGFGLRSMVERVQELGGTFELDSSPGAGTSVRFGLPVHAAATGSSPELTTPR